jgi:putative DNA primase/helicase
VLGDMNRRSVTCTLDANRERPELRQFKRDPVAEVLSDRGRYVAAALTVVLAFIAAGRPTVAPRLPSFGGWSDTVRSALIWLGRRDPIETMEAARKDDPNLQAMESIFIGLKDAIGVGKEQGCTVSQIIQHADLRVGGPNGLQLQHPGLWRLC